MEARQAPPGGLDARRAAREIEREFPGISAWYGESTGTWWALVSVLDGTRLVEAIDSRELRKALSDPQHWPWPRRLLWLHGG